MAQVLIIFQVILMNWYITKVIFAITREDSQSKKQFDEQLRLVAAHDKEEAFFKARAIGLAEEECFINDNNKKVKWEFINVSEVNALKGLEDGAEVYSRIHETEEGPSYIHYVHQKAVDIRLATCMLYQE